jgi:uncharacterized membrane protein
MKLNIKRASAVIAALIGVGVAYSFLTPGQAAAWAAVVAAVAAGYMPQEGENK